MTVDRAAGAAADVRVTLAGTSYPAEPLARGAAYELFSDTEADGFRRDTRPGARAPWHRYAHVTEVAGPPTEATDTPLTAPLSRAHTWTSIHRLAQSAAGRTDPLLHAVRASATVRRGTRMVKVLSPAQFAAHVTGRLPHGFCHRAYDIAHLRTAADLAVLSTDGTEPGDVGYQLRWRAVDPLDYETPAGTVQAGLPGLPPHGRVGAAVLGTGFTPSSRHLVPEYVTAGFADLPLTANAQLVAYTADGDEVVLYAYQPEQRGWLRLAGPRWRHLLAVPGVNPDQEYVPVGEVPRSTHLIGTIGAHTYEAIADPPDEFRVLAMTRAARYPVQSLARRRQSARWHGVPCTVLLADGDWLRVRLSRPDADAVTRLGTRCYERGVYEAWAPAADLTDIHPIDVEYPL